MVSELPRPPRATLGADRALLLARTGAARVPEIMRMDLASPTALG
jgi:hypothetical protein